MAIRAVGTKFKIGNVYVGGLKEIDGPELSSETIDVTTLDSTGGYKVFIGGFKDGGDVSLKGYLDPTSQGQAELKEAFESQEIKPFAIEFPNGIGQWSFNGLVTKYKTGVSVDEPLSFEATIKVSGEPRLILNP